VTFLASNEREQRQLVQGAGMGPGTFEIGGPAAFEGFGTATGLGIGRGLATTGGFLLEVARQSPTYRMQEGLSELFGQGEQFRESERLQDEAVRGAIDYYRVDPATTGFAGQISYGAGAVLLPAIIGSAVAGPAGGAILAGGAVGTGTFADLTGEGVDRDTALRAAGIDAFATGVGVLAPASMGAKLLTKVATGAGVNVALGAGQRYAMGEYLRGAGYGDIAARYDALDATAVATDMVLGAAFGVLPNGARPPQRAVDAAMVSRAAIHAEVDTAPGIPANMQTRAAHVRALDAASEQLLRGQPVRVDAAMRDAQFVPKPDAPKAEVAALVQALDDLGFGQLVGDIRELEAELQGRGRDIVEPALPEVPAAPPRAVAETARTPAPAVIEDLGDGFYEIKGPDGKLLGNALIDEDGPALTIRGVELDSGSRGQGIGMAVYQQILDRAFREGKTLASDSEVTTDAARVYDAIERRGYTVKRNPAAVLGEDGKWRTPDESPVFEVTKAPDAQPTSGAEQQTSGDAAARAERAAETVAAEIAVDKPEMTLPASVVQAIMPDARALTAESQLGRDILMLRAEIGWSERGGRMIRGGQVVDDVNAGADFGRSSGDVVGRTKWTPKARLDGQGESTLWRDRPVKLSEAEAYAALDKFASGQKLANRERGFIAYMGEMSARYDAERAADAAEREIEAIAADIDRRLAMREEAFQVADAMAAADEAVDRATIDSAAYEAAVNCFMRNG
jgi:GNAT superfamily N-acetyltransferase